jgi:RimJ/RimL family protein N-acetyltransferase
VDTADDLALVREAVARLPREEPFGWRDVLGVLGRRRPPEPGQLILRAADSADAALLLDWRNDPDTIRFSGTQRGVDGDEHDAWIEQRLEDPATRIWIGERDGQAVGFVRVDVRDAIGEVSIAVDPNHRGKGEGTALLDLLLHQLAHDFQTKVLTATVHADNAASHKLFEEAGFAPAGRNGAMVLYRRATSHM